jgi:hypothetical protein
MSDVEKLSLTVLHTVAEFLAHLPAEQLQDLAEGRARLGIIPKDASEPLALVASTKRPTTRASSGLSRSRKRQPKTDMSAAAAQLVQMTDRDAAAKYLDGFKKEPQLLDLAALLDMDGVGGLTKSNLIDAIVEFKIGSHLNSSAIRQL